MIWRFLLFVLLCGVVWLFRRALGATGGNAPRRRRDAGAGGRSAVRGEMVRDRICNTYLPRAEALCLSVGGQDHYFCSERCRQSFLSPP